MQFQCVTAVAPIELHSATRLRPKMWSRQILDLDGKNQLASLLESPVAQDRTSVTIPIGGKSTNFVELLPCVQLPFPCVAQGTDVGPQRRRRRLGGNSATLSNSQSLTRFIQILRHGYLFLFQSLCIGADVKSVNPRTTHSRPRSNQSMRSGRLFEAGRPRTVNFS